MENCKSQCIVMGQTLSCQYKKDHEEKKHRDGPWTWYDSEETQDKNGKRKPRG